MGKGKSYSYFNGSRWVGGTAALLHLIKEDGGLESHYKNVFGKAISKVIDERNRLNVKKSIRIVR